MTRLHDDIILLITSPLCLSPSVGEKKSIYVDGEGEVENLGDN